MGNAGKPKKTIIIQTTCLVALFGCAGWLYSSVDPLSKGVDCILSEIKALGSIEPAGSSAALAGAETAAMVPADVMDLMEMLVPLIPVFTITPAAAIAIITGLILLCTLKVKAGAGTKCTRLLMCFNNVFLLLGIVFYLVIGGIGIAMGQLPMIKETLTQVCDDGLTPIQESLDEAAADLARAEADVAAAPPGSAPTSATDAVALATAELAGANAAMSALNTMCDCMDDLIAALASFTFPGLACAACCAVLFIMNCCLCCFLCCCRKKGKTTSAKSAGAASDAEVMA